MKRSHKTLLLVVSSLVLLLALFWNSMGSENVEPEKSVHDLFALLASPESAATIKDVSIEVLGRDSAKYVVRFENGAPSIVVRGPYSGAGNTISDSLSANGVKWTVRTEEEGGFWQDLAISVVPLVLLLLGVLWFVKSGRGGGASGPMSFRNSKAKVLTENSKKVTFKDVAGIQEAKEEVEEIIAFLNNPPKFTRLGGRIPKGVLLMGSPGTGKTLLARAIAGEAGVPFFSIAGSDFVEMFVGVGASRVRDLFEQGKKSAPCIIFIDEIDAVGRHRGAGVGGGNDEREQTLNQLLVEMDGFESNEGVILIAATNRPDVLDPALLRPGRFDRHIRVSLPDINGRLGILEIHTRKIPMGEDVDLGAIARGTSGFSGADLGNLANEGALLAAKRNHDTVDMVDFEDAKDKVLMGNPRNSMFVSEGQRRSSAMLEAGHALVSILIGGDQVDPLHKVTIVPRGNRMGLTMQLPTEDRLTVARDYLLNRICILMGGRVAEELVFQQRSSGASRAIEEATNLARRMVTEWGMSERIGPVKYSDGGHEVFLGLDMSQNADHGSGESVESIDFEVGRFVNEQCDRARLLLSTHIKTLHAVGEALLARETLTGAEVKDLVVANGGVVPAAT